MAQKRMFDKRVVESDKFTDLPNSSKALYFMAGMSADDKGFFQPRRLQKTCGFTDDDFKILLAKGYFIVFESGVMVVTDWNKNNWLDNRRTTETEYLEELKLLKIVNDKYELNEGCLANAKRMLSQNRIEENRIEENRIDVAEITKCYEENIGLMTPATAELLFDYLKDMSKDLIIKAIKIATINNKRNCKYIQGILNDWSKKGFKNLLDVEQEQNEFKNKGKVKEETPEEANARKLKALEEMMKNDIK